MDGSKSPDCGTILPVGYLPVCVGVLDYYASKGINMRIGNSVGLPAFRNTNRANPKYSKSKRKQYKVMQAFMEKLAYETRLNELTTGVNNGTISETTNPAEQTA